MNYQLKILTLTALPILLSIGCVSTNQKLSMSEPQAEEIEATTESIHEQAIANMDQYLKRLNSVETNDEAPLNNNSNIETGSLDHAENVANTEATMENDNTFIIAEVNNTSTSEEIKIDVMDNTAMQISDNSFREEETILLTEKTTTENKVTFIHDELEIKKNSNNENISNNIIEPEKKIFHFSFNKNQPFYNDLTILNQHAQYLITNPNMILNITGHSDKRGNWDYNLKLSELRAKNIATILVAAGVNDSQLRIEGMSDSVPLVIPENWSENRRVELTYQASVVASTK